MPATPQTMSNDGARKDREFSSDRRERAVGAGSEEPINTSAPRSLIRRFWANALHWLAASSFAPGWMPRPLRHPAIGYGAAVVLQLLVTALDLVVFLKYPNLPYHLPFVLVVVIVSLYAGVGPGLVATFVGSFLLYYAVFNPHFTWILYNDENVIGLALMFSICLIVNVLSGQKERARRNAEQARRNSEGLAASLARERARSELERQRLRGVLDVLPVGVFIADAAGQIVDINPEARNVWGQDAPLAQVEHYDAYKGWWPASDRRLAAEEWGLARAWQHGEKALGEEILIETFDGQRKTILNYAVPIQEEATGATAGAVAAMLDISERKALEEALRQSEREAAFRASELEAIFETMVDGVLVYDASGCIQRANAAALDLYGLTPNSAEALAPVAERAPHFKPRDERGQPIPVEQWPVSRILRGEVLSGFSAAEIAMPNLRGREVEISISGAPVRDADGQITGAIVLVRDVTERRRLERRTREALDALVAVAEALTQPPDDLTAQAAEPASPHLVAQRLAGLTCKVLGCQRVSIAVLDAATGHLQPLARAGYLPEEEQRFSPLLISEDNPELAARLRAGETLILRLPDLSQSALRDTDGSHIALAAPMHVGERLVGLLTLDYGEAAHAYTSEELMLAEAVARLGALVIERERLLREREEAWASELALREANRQMDAFLGIASHELKTPLTSIVLGLQVAARRVQKLPIHEAITRSEVDSRLGTVSETLARTNRQAQRLDRLVNDLLDTSRIQAGRLELRMGPADLGAIVREAVEEQREVAPSRGIRLCLPDVPIPPISADAERIGQVVTNYLSNALKYSLEDRPVEVGLERIGPSARVWVRDEGPGLPPEEQKYIWERFYRARGVEVQSGAGVGLGLGLHICRTIIERHQGQVGVQSAPGQGSTFWFMLPVASSLPS